MFPVELTIPEEYVRSLHLAALIFCFWFVAKSDIMAGRSLFRPLRDAEFKTLHLNHKLLIGGLLVFWATGLYLIWLATAFDPSKFSPKLIAKLVVVTVLSVNAMLIGFVALPFFERNKTQTFGEFTFGTRWALSIIAAISSASWFGALCLGGITYLKTASTEELIAFLAPIYAVLGLAATVFAIASRARSVRDDVMINEPASLPKSTARMPTVPIGMSPLGTALIGTTPGGTPLIGRPTIAAAPVSRLT